MIALAAAVAVMLLWLYLLLTRARLTGASFFDMIDTRQFPERWPTVSVIIAARNEADMLRFTLPSVLSSYYPHLEVILVDDCSEDATADAAAATAESLGRPLQVVRGSPPPPGWRGKTWALEQGVRASSSEWLLLTDADILYHPQLLRDLIRMAMTQDYRMASLMAVLRAESFWDRLLLPAFFFFFYGMYPFHRVRDEKSAVAAAAGGCVLVERGALETAGGLAGVRGAWIDDVALAAAVKSSGARIYLGASVQVRSFRRYGTLSAIWRMVARSAFTELRHSWTLVLATVLSLAILFGVPVAGVVAGLSPWAGSAALATLLGAVSGCSLGLMISAYAPAMRLYQLPIVWALTLPVAALLYGAMTVSSALSASFGRGPRWKGRGIAD